MMLEQDYDIAEKWEVERLREFYESIYGFEFQEENVDTL